MEHKVEADLVTICQQIVKEGKAIGEWALIESSDMFQEGKYVGGFDADEEEFCFSVYLDEGEHWFQISIEQAEQIANQKMDTVSARLAEW